MLVKDVDHQHARLSPGGRKAVASLGRLAAAVLPPGAHAAAIKTDTDPLAGQRAMGGDGQTQGGLQGGIAQPGVASAVAVVIRTRLDTSQVKPRRLSMWAASR
jgi:hypothetical protein